MKRGAAGLALLVLVALLAFVLWPGPTSTPSAPVPPPPEPSVRPERKPPAQADPRQVVVIRRPDGQARAEPLPTDDARTAADEPDVHTLDLSTLAPEVLQMRLAEGTEALHQLVEACEEHATEPLKVLAAVTLDERGLQEITLSAYDDDPEGTQTWETEEPLPTALVTCLEEEVWETDWEGTAEGTELPLALSMRLAPE